MTGTGFDPLRFSRDARVSWPRTPDDLTSSSRCPACHADLHSPVCSACGLDLRHPVAAELLALSMDAAALLDRRVALIDRIRSDTARAVDEAARQAAQRPAPVATRAPAPTAAPAARPVAPVLAPAAAAAAVTVPAPFLPPPADPPQDSGPVKPRRSSVQILLLVVGVLLVAVAAIFFLTLAWLFAGLAVRSLIGALLTVVALTIAAVMRRRGLTATAEGIGALAVVLVLLDAWAMRQNDLFTLASADFALYWGIALSLCAALFLAWHALSRLRVASVTGFLAAPLGLALLAAGLASELSDSTRLFVGLLAAALGALLHRVTLSSGTPHTPGRWPSIDRVVERMALVGLGSIALVSASLTAVTVQPASALAPLWAFGSVTVVAILHVGAVLTVTATPAPTTGITAGIYRLFAYGSAVIAAATACSIAPALAGRVESLPLLLTTPVLVAVTLALLLELLGRRRAASPPRRAILAAATTAALVGASFALAVGGFAAWPLGTALAAGLTGNGSPVAEPSADNWWALFALAATGALAGLFWWRGALLRTRGTFVIWLALATVLATVPFAGALWLVLVLYVVIAVLALAALIQADRGGHTLGAVRVHWGVLLVTATTFAYLISWASSDTWWVGTLFVVVVLGAGRLLFDARTGQVARGIMLSGALLFALSAAAIAPWALTLGENPSSATTQVTVATGLSLAAGLFQLLLAAGVPRGLSDTERLWAFYTLLLPTVAVCVVPVATLADRLTNAETATLLLDQPFATVLAATLLAAAATIWVLRAPSRTALRWPRLIAAGALAPALLLLVNGLLETTDAPAVLVDLAAPLMAVATCALALARPTDRARPAIEIGAGLILVPSLLLITVTERPLDWLALLLAGLATLLVAVAPDGLFASRSARRHLGWLAVLLASIGLWLGLARGGTETVEPYVLPVAGLLLVIAALVRRFGRVARTEGASPVAAVLLLVALLVALVPLAVAGQTGSLARPLIVGVISALLLVGASAVPHTPPRAAYLAAAGWAGAIGVVVTGTGRIVDVLQQPGMPDARLELWLLLPCASAVVAALLLAGKRHAVGQSAGQSAGPSVGPSLRATASRALLIGALVVATGAQVASLAFAPYPADTTLLAVRMAGLVIALSAVHVLALSRPLAPLGAVTAWSSIGLAAISAGAALSVDAVTPMELLTVPVGLALVLGQVNRAAARTAAADAAVGHRRRSLIVTAGLAIALLPSALSAGDGTLLRPVSLLVVGGTLAIAAALLLERPGVRELAGPSYGIGVLTVAVTASVRILPLLPGGPTGPGSELEAWLLPSVLLVVSAGATLVTSAARAHAPTGRVGYGIVAGALVVFTVAELAALSFTPLAATRVVFLVWLFASLHLALFWVHRSVQGRQLSWLAVALAGFAVLAGLYYSVPDPVELVTVPLGVALLVSGWLHLERTSTARSWRWLAPGLLLLLGPSLLFDLGDSALWRVVALGVVAVGVLIVGLVQRLQAPFMIGVVVLLIHGTAQLWPWISLAYGAVPWWLWLGVGGILLIVLAARYEQRIKDFTSIALKISALR